MLIKIYSQPVAEVEAALREADATSFQKTGSHDTSHRKVVVNGVARFVRKAEHMWVGVIADYSKVEKDPGEMPAVIMTAAILEADYHYGSNCRAHSVLRLYLRHSEHQESFLVVDVGQITDNGEVFETADLYYLLANAKKPRIEVAEELQDSLQLRGLSPYFYSFEMLEKVGSDYLRPGSAHQWFPMMFREAVQLLARMQQVAKQMLGDEANYVLNDAYRPFFDKTVLGKWLKSYPGGTEVLEVE